MDFGQIFQEQILPQLVVIGSILLSAIVVYAKTAVGKWIKGKVENQAIEGALLWVNEAVFDEVAAASQTSVRELKRALADGKITPEEYKMALEKVKSGVIKSLKDKTLGRLLGSGVAATTGEAISMIEAKVEAAVPKTKAIQNAAAKTEDP